jgi:hypothetical protein
MDPLVQAFFKSYEVANSSSDLAAIGDLYAETFLFAGPSAVCSVRREDFLKAVPKMKTQITSLGLTESRLSSVEAANLDSRYVLAKVQWTMTLRTAEGLLNQLEAFATYVLQRCDGKLSIIFQVDHQDLAAVIHDKRHMHP